MSARRAVLSVPASEPRKILKALAADVDEVVVDLEDAVAVTEKNSARAAIASLAKRGNGQITVRVNALGTPWVEGDLSACVDNDAVSSIVLPKAEDPLAVALLAAHLKELEAGTSRSAPLRIQALLETPLGIHQAVEIARATERLCALIIGYADLSASIGRRPDASWQFAQDAVVVAARIAGLQAIDGPLLSVADDERLLAAATHVESLGFDGKWVIHPAQVATVQAVFSPSQADVDEAVEILAAMSDAAVAGRGAVQWRGRMLDEALALKARRTMARVSNGTERHE